MSGIEHHLTDAAPDELEQRRERVARALADFDAATIATTHEFCLKMLDGLGVLGDREPQAAFVEHLSDLTREVATDLYLRRYAAGPDVPMKYAEALTVADLAVQAVHARLVPDGPDQNRPDQPNQNGPDRTDGTERVAFAEAVRAEVDRRKRAGRLFSYDDMLTRLRDALADPEHGAAAAGRLRQRFRVVMVDEFQDTDPVQWEILHRAFHGAATLILIGDPKQAIYAFRGADVYSYLDAVSRADRVCTLETNWRSDQALVDALESLIGGATLGEDEIVVRPVKADHQQRRLISTDDPGSISAGVDGVGPDPVAGVPAPTGRRDRTQRGQPAAADHHRSGGRCHRLAGQRGAGRSTGRDPSRSNPPISPCWCAPTSGASRSGMPWWPPGCRP